MPIWTSARRDPTRRGPLARALFLRRSFDDEHGEIQGLVIETTDDDARRL
jgi:hypothetical protein